MKSIKTLAFASLVAFSTLAFTACGTKSGEATTTDSTTVTIDETVIDETAASGETDMMQNDTTKVEGDSTATGAGM